MTKTFCNICGQETGIFAMTHFKTMNGQRVRMTVTAIAEAEDGGHICDACGAILLAEVLEKLRGIIAARQNQGAKSVS